jgi:hypothetical protein
LINFFKGPNKGSKFMKITKSQLKQIIQEELDAALSEGVGDDISKLGDDLGTTFRRAGRDIKDWAGSTADTFRAAREVLPGGGGLRAALRHKKKEIHQEILNTIAKQVANDGANLASSIVDSIPGDWAEEAEEAKIYIRRAINRSAPGIADMVTNFIVGEDPELSHCPPCKDGARSKEPAYKSGPHWNPSTGFRESVTKSQLQQIIREEIKHAVEESQNMKDKAIRSAWELYCNDKGGSRPDQPHPDGEKAAERCEKRRKKARLAKGKALQTEMRESEEKKKCKDKNGVWRRNPKTGKMECDTSDSEDFNDPKSGKAGA